MNSDYQKELDAINQLVSYQLACNILPFDKRFGDFITYAFKQIHGVLDCITCFNFVEMPAGSTLHENCASCHFFSNEGTIETKPCQLFNVPGFHVISIQTASSRFGYIAISTTPDFKTNVLSAIKNFGNVVAVNLENKIQKDVLEKQNAELQQYKNDLEEHIKLRTIELEQKNAELKKSNSDKDRFLSILSHDLRSPFNSLLGFSALLLENVHHVPREKIAGQLAIMNNTIEQTYNLLEDLLAWSKTQSGKLPYMPQKLALNEICQFVVTEKRAQANLKNLHLNFLETEDILIFADQNLLKTILRNLIGNAIKFTHSGGKIFVYTVAHNEWVNIVVSDSGVGMLPEVISKLWDFSKPYKTEGTNHEKGSGLGLVLCKEFVEKHGGKIWVESQVNKGSDFYFSLPLWHNQTEAIN